MFTLKKLLLNNLITLGKSLTLEINHVQKNQCSGIGFTGFFKKTENYDNVVN
jgi:hypothetical protein